MLGAQGLKLPDHDGRTQDFKFATGLAAIKSIEIATGMPEVVKQAVSGTWRIVNAARNPVGTDSSAFGFFGHIKFNSWRTPVSVKPPCATATTSRRWACSLSRPS